MRRAAYAKYSARETEIRRPTTVRGTDRASSRPMPTIRSGSARARRRAVRFSISASIADWSSLRCRSSPSPGAPATALSAMGWSASRSAG
ncbi:hypothetical protein STANM309S_06405 [Streptomyces tanashiensis]